MGTAVWVDEGHPLDTGKLRAHGITAPYFSHRFGNATASILQAAKDAGFAPGVYSAWNWFANLDGPAYARLLDSELRRIAWPGNPPLCVDIETHDVGYILGFLSEWRRLRPTRATAWTLEGFQGGLFDRGAVAAIVAANVRIVPQLYRGNMEPLEHSPVIDLLQQGFPGERIDGFYDAARLPYRWRGFAFTQARLP